MRIARSARYPVALGLLVALAVLITNCQEEGPPASREDGPPPGVVDGIDTLTGLIAAGDYLLVKGNCLACHSAKLITQNRADREGWLGMIHWMQEKQNLPDLGPHEGPILDYLSTYYAPEESGRRPPLEVTEWYELPD